MIRKEIPNRKNTEFVNSLQMQEVTTSCGHVEEYKG